MRHATTPPTGERSRGTDSRKAQHLRLAATVVAATFVLVGIAGFIPGLTTNAGDLEFLGTHDDTEMGGQAELLGVFHVSILHNLVHLGFGIAGLALARSVKGASGFLYGGAIIYAAVLVYGLVIDQDSDANFLPVNDADNVLHAALVAGMLLLAVLLTPRRDEASAVTRRDDLA